jgi:hypothetical protein
MWVAKINNFCSENNILCYQKREQKFFKCASLLLELLYQNN